jgi:hypothetical protein
MEAKEMTIFQKLCIKMVEDQGFAARVLYGTGQERLDALKEFLDEVGFEGDRAQVLDDLIVALSRTDIGALDRLRQTLDGRMAPELAF